MTRLLACLALLLAATATARSDPQFFRIATPAAPNSTTPQLVTATDGEVWMAWVETLPGDEGHRLVCARFEAVRSRWSEPREIARGRGWIVNWADTPQFAAGRDGRLAALWYVANAPAPGEHHGSYRAWTSRSEDAGATWSTPEPLSPNSESNEFASLAPLDDGRWLAVWLDGRARHATPGGPQQLFGGVLGDRATETLLDDRVCDCCPTDLATLPDGSAYAVYRDRSDSEVRDLGAVRWRDGRWTPARGLPTDGWKIDGCPVNGPALTRAGSRLGLTWFTAPGDGPQVKGAVSTDFAVQWTMSHPLDGDTRPLGRVANVLLPDGTLWSTWVQADGSIALAPLAPGGSPGPVHVVTPQAQAGEDPRHRAVGTPRLTLVARAPGATTRLLIAYTQPASGEATAPRVGTTLVTLPASAGTNSVRVADDCGCDRNTAQTGHAVRGRIVRLLPERDSVLVAHEEVPGVMRAMTMAFRVDPRLLQFLQPEQEILARMERRDDGYWWLFGVRIVRQPPTALPAGGEHAH